MSATIVVVYILCLCLLAVKQLADTEICFCHELICLVQFKVIMRVYRKIMLGGLGSPLTKGLSSVSRLCELEQVTDLPVFTVSSSVCGDNYSYSCRVSVQKQRDLLITCWVQYVLNKSYAR